jgi:hypothetical protein
MTVSDGIRMAVAFLVCLALILCAGIPAVVGLVYGARALARLVYGLG